MVHAYAHRIILKADDTLQHLLDTAVGPHLCRPKLCGIKLTVTGVSGLASAPWSALTSLTLGNCGLNSSAISKVAAGYWPVLHEFL